MIPNLAAALLIFLFPLAPQPGELARLYVQLPVEVSPFVRPTVSIIAYDTAGTRLVTKPRKRRMRVVAGLGILTTYLKVRMPQEGIVHVTVQIEDTAYGVPFTLNAVPLS